MLKICYSVLFDGSAMLSSSIYVLLLTLIAVELVLHLHYNEEIQDAAPHQCYIGGPCDLL